MTDHEINEALAVAMGKIPAERTKVIGGQTYTRTVKVPDYFSPASSAELEDWLASRGWSIDTHQHQGWTAVNLCSPEGHPDPCDIGDDVEGVGAAHRRRALAMAAWQGLCGGKESV